jgi:2',3'-cyclic-nucleotide 2'-phosphodiesterase (5'-nucleotidase family)
MYRLITICVFLLGLSPVFSHAHAADITKFRLFFTASVKGYLDQCGCKYNPSGGITRRATFLKRSIDGDTPWLLLDGGEVIGYRSDLEQVKTTYLFRAMKTMGYRTIGVGPRDLTYDLTFLNDAESRYGFRFTCANLLDDTTGKPYFRPWVTEIVGGSSVFGIHTGGVKLGVVSVMGTDRAPKYYGTSHTFRLADPVESARKAAAELRDETDLVVVMAYGNRAMVDSIRALDNVDIVLASRPLWGMGKYVQAGKGKVAAFQSYQGRGVVWIDIEIGKDRHITHAKGDIVWLTDSITDDPEMAKLRKEFEERKKAMEGSK